MKRYASFFDWRDRQQAELGVVEELVSALADRGERRFSTPQSYKPDPPDCVCLNEDGQRVAVEVTEVVCSKAVSANAQGHEVYRNWRPGELYEHLAQQLRAKDQKSFHGGPYREIVVCLFTDEPLLTINRVTKELEASVFGPYAQVTAAYLLVSYDPSSKTYPVHTIHIKNAA